MPWRAVDFTELPPDQQKQVLDAYNSPYLKVDLSYFADRDVAEIAVDVPAASPLRRQPVGATQLAMLVQSEIERAVNLLILQTGQLPRQSTQDTKLTGQTAAGASLIFEVRMASPHQNASQVSLSAADTRSLRQTLARGESLSAITARATAATREALSSQAFSTAVGGG
jgi:hypothetical protein